MFDHPRRVQVLQQVFCCPCLGTPIQPIRMCTTRFCPVVVPLRSTLFSFEIRILGRRYTPVRTAVMSGPPRTCKRCCASLGTLTLQRADTSTPERRRRSRPYRRNTASLLQAHSTRLL